MRDYAEFKYHNHFFESERLLNNLIIQIFPEFSWRYYKCNNAVLLDNGFLDMVNSDLTEISEVEYKLERSHKYQTLNYELQDEIMHSKKISKTIGTYMEYLFVEFQHYIHDVYKETESQNEAYLFDNVFKAIEESNDYYSSLLENPCINNIQKRIIKNLLYENQRKPELIKNEFSNLVPYVDSHFSKNPFSESLINAAVKKSQNFHSIFISKNTEDWFIHAMEQLNWINQSDKRGFQAKVLAFYDLDECKKSIFKRTVYKKDFIEFLNTFYQKEVIKPAKNYSKSDNSQADLKKHIIDFPIPVE